MYAPATPRPETGLPAAPQASDPVAEVIDRACAHGDERVIKFTDTAAWVYQQTANPAALAAAVQSTRLLDPPA